MCREPAVLSGNKLPYDDFADAYWNQSPLKYIKNAKTPTMIHVVKEIHAPRPQSEELFMALKRLEFQPSCTSILATRMNPGSPQSAAQVGGGDGVDGLPGQGSGKKFAWRDVLKTLDPEGTVSTATAASTSN
jgi:hypothetical protein